jgi:excisionase family DNA binding protein
MPGRHLTAAPGILPPQPAPPTSPPQAAGGTFRVRHDGHGGPSPVLVPAPVEVLTLQDAAVLLQVDTGALRRLAEAGELPGRFIGGHWRFSRWAVLEWLARGGGPAQQRRAAAAQPRPMAG